MAQDDKSFGAPGKVAPTAADGQSRAEVLAQHFADAAATGDVDSFLLTVDDLDLCEGAWELAMRRIGELTGVPDSIRQAFLDVWALHQTLPDDVGDPAVLAKALRILMPA